MVHTVVPVLRVGTSSTAVDNVNSLSFIVGDANNETVIVLGSAVAGDGGSQTWRWVSDSTKDGDGTYCVKPLGQVRPGRWEAVLQLPSGVATVTASPVPATTPTPSGGTTPDPTFVAILSPVSGASVSGVIPVVVQATPPLLGVALADTNNNTLAIGVVNPLNVATINFDSAKLGSGAQTLRALAYDTVVGGAYTNSRATQVALNVTVPSQTNPGTATSGTPSTTPTPSPAPAPSPAPVPVAFVSPITQTSALEVFYDFASGNSVTTVGGTISQTLDLSGKNHTLLTSGTGPTWTGGALGGLSAARYNGTFNIFLAAQGSAGNVQNMWSSGGTMMAVMYARSIGGGAGGFARLIDKTDDVNTGWCIETVAGQFNFMASFSGTGAASKWGYVTSSAWSYGNNTPFILEVDYDSRFTSSSPTVRVNGTILTPGNTSNVPPSGAYKTDTNNFLVMSAIQSDWDLGSLLLWPKTLSDDQRVACRAYLSNRWSIGVAPSAAPSVTPTNPNTPVSGGGSQPASSQDITSAAVPAVSAQSNNGWSCVGDFTFGTQAGSTISGVGSFNQHCISQYPGGVSRLNDEWENYTNFAQGDLSGHSFQTDHIRLTAFVRNTTLFNQHVARCQASVLPPGQTPDNHDWGSWQGGTGGPAGWDTGVRSGMIWFQRTQKYGYFEWKAQVPPSTPGGWWPANWIVDGGTGTANNGGPTRNWPPEIDVLEMACNNAPDNSFNSFHNCATGPNNSVPSKTTISGALDQFGSYHGGFDQSVSPTLYGLLWQQGDQRGDHFTIYVNNSAIWDGYYQWTHSDGSPAGVAYFYSNLAYGGNWPGRLGAAANITNLPVNYKLYYFRMFAK